MPTTGPWMDDATPVDQLVMLKTTGENSESTWAWSYTGKGASQTDYEGALLDAWKSGPLFSENGFQRSSSISVSIGVTSSTPASAEWTAVWLTCDKPPSVEVAGSTPPAGWDSDPNVIGVEWEPTTTVNSQRLEVTAYDIPIGAFGSRSFHVKIADGISSAIFQPAPMYVPAFNTTYPDADITGAPFRSGDADIAVAEISNPPMTLSPGGGRFAVAILDDYTALLDGSSAALTVPLAANAFYRLRVKLFYAYRPRYRLIYTDAPVIAAPAASARVTPSLRMLQRGGAGGMAGIPRMVGDPTRRGIRQGPGSVY